jgi:hypothetical protein
VMRGSRVVLAQMQPILAHRQPSPAPAQLQSLSEWTEAFLTILPEAHQKGARWAVL